MSPTRTAQIFAELCRRLEANRPVSLTAFSEVLDEPLMTRLSWLIADNDSLRFDREQVEDYIRRHPGQPAEKEQ